MTAGSWLDYSHGMWMHVWQIGRNMFMPDSDTLFLCLAIQENDAFPMYSSDTFQIFW